MAIAYKTLGQVKIASANTPEALYSPAASTTGIILNVFICEENGAAATFSLYLDENGSGTASVNTLFKDIDLDANETKVLTFKLPIDDAAGTLSCEASTTDVVFTAVGLEIT